jgi:hypothetical protein
MTRKQAIEQAVSDTRHYMQDHLVLSYGEGRYGVMPTGLTEDEEAAVVRVEFVSQTGQVVKVTER